MRVLGIDFGEKRIGLAVSDPTGTLASPLETLQRRRGKRPPLQGTEDDWCAEVRRVGDALGERTGLPVGFIDERFSSRQAERAVRSSGLRKTQREEKARIDAGAATVILQAFLDGAPER